MINITQDLLTSTRNRPALRSNFYKLRKLKGIVIHWTANPFKGANAQANRNYFNRSDRFASAHYCVDDKVILQCIPDDELGFHVGAKTYKPAGQKMIEGGLNPNYFTIGIEMCINHDADWSKVYQNTIELTRHLLNKHKLTTNDLYRHFDITGKDCPKMMITKPEWDAYVAGLKKTNNIDLKIGFNSWEQFKRDVNKETDIKLPDVVRHGYVNTADLNIRKGPGTQFPILGKLKQDDRVTIFDEVGNWFRIGDDQWVGKLYVVVQPPMRVAEISTATFANVRKGPDAKQPVVRTLSNGDMINIHEEYNSWYRIGVNEWVHSSLAKMLTVSYARVKVNEFLNVRTGPGTNFPRVRTLPNGEVVKVFEIENGFARLGDKEWVNNAFLVPIA